MSPIPDLSDLLGPSQEALTKAFERGVTVGAEATLNDLADYLRKRRGEAPLTAIDAEIEATPKPFELSNSEPIRAPRGLIDDVLDKALAARPGMSTHEAENAVVALDQRIAIKSVYNRLRFFEKQGRRFKRVNGLWYRIGDAPKPWNVPSSPQGETGGVAPPASGNGSDKAASLTATGGGT